MDMDACRALVDAHFATAYEALERGDREPTHLEVADYILANYTHVDLRDEAERKRVLDMLADAVSEHWDGLELAPPAES